MIDLELKYRIDWRGVSRIRNEFDVKTNLDLVFICYDIVNVMNHDLI